MLIGIVFSANRTRISNICDHIRDAYGNFISLRRTHSEADLFTEINYHTPDIILLDMHDCDKSLLLKIKNNKPKNCNIWLAITDLDIKSNDQDYKGNKEITFFRSIQNAQIEKQMSANCQQHILRHSTFLKNKINKIAVPTPDGFFFLNTHDILRLEAKGTYTNIYLPHNKKIISSRNIGEYEQMLLDFPFFRIHQSHIINLNKIQRYQKGRGGLVYLEDGTHLEVASRRRNEFIQLFEHNS